jgi:hypothetical protein
MTRYPRRSGQVLVAFVVVLTALFGLLGLVLDGGLLMGSHRRTQNVADAAALAAAMKLMRGETPAAARASATTYVRDHNQLADADVTVNIPPASGPNAGSARHAEVIVSRPYETVFAHLIGAQRNQWVVARACGGFEQVEPGEGVIALDPRAIPGISVSGGASLTVDGSLLDNSQGAGLDQYGARVDWGFPTSAFATGNGSTVRARYVQVRGGVDTLDNFRNFVEGGPSPLFAGAPIVRDPLRNLPVPRPATVPSITDWSRHPAVIVNGGETQEFTPGVYTDIQVNTGGTARFAPGVYILSAQQPNQGLRFNGGGIATGDGVMFYLTGSNYLDNAPGYWDALDDAQNALDGPLPPTSGAAELPAPPDPNFNTVRYASLTSNANSGTVALTGLKDPASPFNGVLIFQGRRNPEAISIEGNPGPGVALVGAIYAKWALLKLSGSGTYRGPFVVGSLALSGSASLSVGGNGSNFGLARRVYLVE